MDHQLWHIADRLPPGLTRIRCPYCSDERRRTNQNTKTLSITIEDRFALYNCHHCNEHGRFSLDRDRQEQIRYKRQEKPLPPASSRILNQPHIAYLASRGISLETANKAGVYSIDVYMREHGDLNALAFTYPTATKFRATHIKGFSSHGAACHYYLQNLVVDGSPLVITEGEMDALNLVAVG